VRYTGFKLVKRDGISGEALISWY